jgi:hypothetical protein
LLIQQISSSSPRKPHTSFPRRLSQLAYYLVYRLQNHSSGSAIGLCFPAEIVLMPRRKTTPIVRVVFACTGCSAPFEATQIHRPANGTFACGFCGEEVYLWSGHYDYTNWRSIRDRGTEKHGRGRYVQQTMVFDDYSRSRSIR